MKLKGGHLIAKLAKNHCRNYAIRQSTTYLAKRSYPLEYAEHYGFSKKDVKEFNFITHILRPWAEKKPDHCALWLSDGTKSTKLSYSELLSTSQHLANALQHIGSPKCAMLVLPKVSPWWTINIAGSFTGMIISPGTTMLTDKEILYRLESCNADAIICSAELMNTYANVTKHLPYRIVAEENPEDLPATLKDGWLSYHDLVKRGSKLSNIEPINDPDAVAQLFFTSGTTGKPKMVPHTQVGFGIGHQEAARDVFRLATSDTFWNLTDLGWAKAAYSSLYIPLIAGSTMFLHQMPRFDAKVVMDTLRQEPITAFCCPPTALRSIIQEDISSFNFRSLNRVFSAGEPLNPEVIDIWTNRTGVPIYEAYGQTEMTVVAATKVGDLQKPGSMGKAALAYDVAIIDDDFNHLKDDQIGQIAISTKKSWPFGLCKEYFNSEAQTKKSFVDGYYLTGDKARRDKDGYFWYVGRADDIIISAGYRIGPFEVESALLEHPAVKESAVIGSPDSFRGHVVKAFIVLTDQYINPANPEELKKDIQDFMKRTIAPYKYPRKIEFAENLPKTISGKIRRVELRDREQP